MASSVTSVAFRLACRQMPATLTMVVSITLSLVVRSPLPIARLPVLINKADVLRLCSRRYASLIHHNAIGKLHLNQGIHTHLTQRELLHEHSLLLGVYGSTEGLLPKDTRHQASTE